MIPAALVALVLPARADARSGGASDARSAIASVASTAVSSNGINTTALLDSLRGRSRKLRARFLAPNRAAGIPVLRTLFGDSSVTKAGVYAAADSSSAGTFNFITMRPFSDKVSGRIGSYRIGFFPQEQRGARSASYVNPEGFLEVTAGNQFTLVSEHFRLADFLTHDQAATWPKYLVLREPLIDKLELVIAELRYMGVTVKGMKVMSGFRTPQYNQQGVGAGGRATDSRHQYGDAADVYIVNGARDWMSDLNADGRVDARDARVLAMAAERVEAKNPDLVGGIGIYKATAAHGPFVHIDVRGSRARWGE
ncbi:MAG: hypothetical protein ABIW79_05890 [Gemmatimonas sp.]